MRRSKRTRDAARHAAGAAVALDDPQVALGAALGVGSRRRRAAPVELWRIAGTRAARMRPARVIPMDPSVPAFVMPAGEVTLVASPLREGVDSTLRRRRRVARSVGAAHRRVRRRGSARS
jgi:hypothetical protein